MAPPAADQRVPDRNGPRSRDPQLVPQIAGVSGTRDLDLDTGDAVLHHTEVPEAVDGLLRNGVEHRARQRALQRESRNRIRHLADLDFHAERVLLQPAKTRLARPAAVPPVSP